MLRRTQVKHVAPLLSAPVLKAVGVAVRLFTRPLVAQLVASCDNHPHMRAVCIRVGWWHFRTSITLHQMIWGAEERQKLEQERKANELKQEKHSSAAAATAAAAASGNLASDAEATTAAAASKLEAFKSMSLAGRAPLMAVAASSAAAATIKFNLGGVVKSPEPKSSAAVGAAEPAAVATTSAAANTSSSSSNNNKPAAATTPQSLRLLPRSFNPIVQVRNVRRIFIAPPRPSDQELMKKGMSLIVELLLFFIIMALVLYEAWYAAQAAKEAKKIIEARFARLEAHMLDCPGSLFDEVEHQLQVSSTPATKSSSSTAAAVVAADAKAKSAAAAAIAVDDAKTKKAAATSATAAPSAASTSSSSTAMKNKDEVKSNGAAAAAQAVETSATAVASAEATSLSGDTVSAVHKKPRLFVVAIAAQMQSLQDLWNAWTALPSDVRTFLFIFWFVPYVLMGAIGTRLLLKK